jgi:large subunit ribosomal protein L24
MKKQFSTSWKTSKKPRKQRKYLIKAPLHIKRNFLSVNLAKNLRKSHGIRNIIVKKGDIVGIQRGKFKKKQGKVLGVDLKRGRVNIEGITMKKLDGSKKEVPIRASNLQIMELNLEDKKRINKVKKQENK